ncbi:MULTISPECIES: 5'-3' exonuclease [unclassified Gordonia (in: high G+C Gram-positive bacteria)]|uniref:5'-3' exonuclease n=1 Tax=Gordonia TaxID=2053 RepID=UPI00071D6096|nr:MULTISPECIES: 5'-3' exonuclease [unclassified Gordonia (in: high G+C Gram-positive bacteria)]MCZ4536558.1 5'-3' exonuclease [Gordonia terrae]KSU60236.1 5'-3' exonuclease [Gordonia sp. SGD-V-85]MBR7193575.1 5'-3' exonuclease [Gordonia sp. SCSIO 19800]MCX2755908.1 5'-3' exonuclease [Gordonia sp. 4N]MDT0223273.1 5'-3' exonuclease [Gordonia sp. AC31]
MLLDGASLWFRSFFALPEKMTSPDGRPVNAVRGFVDTIANLVVRERPTRLVVCLDLDWRPEFRTDLIPTYKAHRVAVPDGGTDVEGRDIDVEEVPDTLTPQVDMIMAVLSAAGIATSGAVGCEADDVIGTLAYDEANDPVIVVSGDRDLLQVVADDPVPVRVLYVGRGLAKAEMMGPVEVAEKYGVPVERAGIGYAEMSMLRGDPSDGLPGVAGIGEKTAAKLITEYGSLDALEAAAADPSSSVPTRSRKALLASVEYLQAARTVVSVRTDAETIDSGSDILPAEPADPAALAELVEELGIGASVGRLAKALGWPQAG